MQLTTPYLRLKGAVIKHLPDHQVFLETPALSAIHGIDNTLVVKNQAVCKAHEVLVSSFAFSFGPAWCHVFFAGQ